MKVVQNDSLKMRYIREIAEKKQRIEELTKKRWFDGAPRELDPASFARIQSEHDASIAAQARLGGNPLGVDADKSI